MSEVLLHHIQKFVNLREEEGKQVISFFEPRTVQKKQDLLNAGAICRHQYFVSKGCLRMFYIDQKGVEKTVQFAIENWWLADYFSFQRVQASEFGIQAVETSEVLAIDTGSFEELLREVPKMERYFRMVHQTAHAAAQVKHKFFSGLSKEELFNHFRSNFPEFVQRVPQYLLASYLDVTPEYLSELRAKSIS